MKINLIDRYNPSKVWHIEYKQKDKHYYLSQSVNDRMVYWPSRYLKRDIERVLNIKLSKGCKDITILEDLQDTRPL